MLIGTVRPDESRTFEVQGYEFDEINDLIAEQTPAGWDLASAPVAMAKRDTVLTATATIVRRDGLQEIEAEDMDDVLSKVPEGYKLISVRSV